MSNNPNVTKLCWAWKITRKDGAAFGFTDHDRDLRISGLNYQASSGFTASDIDSKTGLAADNSAVQAILSAEAITSHDIDAGLYDGADVLIRRVSWETPQNYTDIWRGYIGAISRSGDQFTAELMGQTSRLSRSTGRVFSKHCDAEFGDGRCGLNAANFPNSTACPRTFSACRDQFSNSQNFRGFPYLIGDDAMQAGADSAASRSGGSRYGHLL